MISNIIFFGGIHGVGKSTMCHHICDELDFEYLSASELLRWEEININSKNKKVANIQETQNRLISNLKNTIKKDKFYILDGHYCLFNKNAEVEKIPLETFKQINPIALCLILGNINEIKNRLEKRDHSPYNIKNLENLQNGELNYATYLSSFFNVPLFVSNSDDSNKILNSIRKINKFI